MRHIFRRSGQVTVAAGTVDTGAARGAQEQREQTQAPPNQDTQRPTDNSETRAAPTTPDNNVDTEVGPSGNTGEGGVDPANGASTALSPDPALVGSEVDAAQQALDCISPASRIGQRAIGLIAQADAKAINVQNFSDRYLQPLKTFHSVVSTIAKVHPYAQIALGVLTAAAQLLIDQANLDHEVSDPFNTVKMVYGLLLEDV